MPWHIGIDEAGYGPNLGPFVMSSVACHLPESPQADLWSTLKNAVRKSSAVDHRIFVADSKQVFSQAKGMRELEKTVLVLNKVAQSPLATWLELLCLSGWEPLQSECWFTGGTILPIDVDGDGLAKSALRFFEASSAKQITWGPVHCVVVCPEEFNATIDKYQSKGAVLGACLVELLKAGRATTGAEPASIFIDKHGGRNQYSPILQSAFDDEFVVPLEESAKRSVYKLMGSDAVKITVEPRADARHFCVALASMVSKYVRELLMAEFNGFWQTHVKGLKPTAGYPVDALRFFGEIESAMGKLGIAKCKIWRER